MTINGVEYTGEKLKAHIEKFKPAGEVAKPKHNMPLYYDVCTFFKVLFAGSKIDRFKFGPEELIAYLQEAYKIEYTPEQYVELKRMLHMGYKFYPEEGYEFLRSDFILEVKA